MRKFWQSIQEVGMLNGDRDLRNLEGGRLSFLRVLRVGVTQGVCPGDTDPGARKRWSRGHIFSYDWRPER